MLYISFNFQIKTIGKNLLHEISSDYTIIDTDSF